MAFGCTPGGETRPESARPIWSTSSATASCNVVLVEGKSKSSDAAYELASQLLAARFNLAAGAETCGAVQRALLDGQTLLDGLNFSGSGDHLGSKSKDARRAQALSLAATLDRYNNGNLC